MARLVTLMGARLTTIFPVPVSTLVPSSGCTTLKVTVNTAPASVTVTGPPTPGSRSMAFAIVVASAAVPVQVRVAVGEPLRLSW